MGRVLLNPHYFYAFGCTRLSALRESGERYPPCRCILHIDVKNRTVSVVEKEDAVLTLSVDSIATMTASNETELLIMSHENQGSNISVRFGDEHDLSFFVMTVEDTKSGEVSTSEVPMPSFVYKVRYGEDEGGDAEIKLYKRKVSSN